MPSLKSIVGLALLGLLIVQTGHAQESEDCPYPKGRTIEDLAAALAAHEEWVETVVYNQERVSFFPGAWNVRKLLEAVS